MKLPGCGNSHFIWSIKNGDVKKVHNTDSQGRPGLKFKKLDDILQSVDGEYTPLVFAERRPRERSGYVAEKDEPDFSLNENDVEELTLSQLMKKCKSKKRKASEPVPLTPKEEEDGIDLSEPLFKFKKVSKRSPSRKIPASKSSTGVSDLVVAKVKVEALDEEYFDCSESIDVAADPLDCNQSSMFVASEDGFVHVNDEVNNTGSGSVAYEGEIFGVSEVSLDNLESMELDDEENMPNDLLALSVSERDEEEYVDQSLSIVSSQDDSSFEDLNCFQSQLYLQQTPEEVSDISDSQDSDLAIQDDHIFTDLGDEGSPRNQEFGSPSLAPDNSHSWPNCDDLDDGDVVPADAGSPIPEEKQQLTPVNCADSNFMNVDDNSVASEDVPIVQEQSSFVPEDVDSEVNLTDQNHQTDVTSEAAEIRNSDCLETLQPERLPLTRKVLDS